MGQVKTKDRVFQWSHKMGRNPKDKLQTFRKGIELAALAQIWFYTNLTENLYLSMDVVHLKVYQFLYLAQITSKIGLSKNSDYYGSAPKQGNVMQARKLQPLSEQSILSGG